MPRVPADGSAASARTSRWASSTRASPSIHCWRVMGWPSAVAESRKINSHLSDSRRNRHSSSKPESQIAALMSRGVLPEISESTRSRRAEIVVAEHVVHIENDEAWWHRSCRRAAHRDAVEPARWAGRRPPERPGPCLPQVPMPGSSAMSLPTIEMRVRASAPCR